MGLFEITDRFQVLRLPSYTPHHTCSLHTESSRTLAVCQVYFRAFASLLCFCVSVSFIITFWWWGSCLDPCSVLVFVFSSDEVNIFLPCSWPFRAIAYPQKSVGNTSTEIACFQKKCGVKCKSLQMAATAIKCSTSPSPLPLATFTHHRYDYECLNTPSNSGSHIGKGLSVRIERCSLAWWFCGVKRSWILAVLQC